MGWRSTRRWFGAIGRTLSRLWQVILNSGDLGHYPGRESAMQRAEDILKDNMHRVVEDGEYYLHAKKIRVGENSY